MKTTVINGITYRLGTSTWHADYASLFIEYPSGVVEYCVRREWDSIKDNADAQQALRELWPSQFK